MELAVTDALDGFMSWDDGGMSTDEGLTCQKINKFINKGKL